MVINYLKKITLIYKKCYQHDSFNFKIMKNFYVNHEHYY